MDIGAKSMSALRWGAGTKIVGQLAAWAMTIVVIRLLSPEDYGLMAMATIFISFLTLMNETGMRAVLIQAAEITDELIRPVFGLIVLVNLFLFLLMLVSSPWIADFFNEPRLKTVISVLSLHFLLSSLEIVPTSLLIRDFNLKKKEMIYAVSSFLGGVVTLIMALMQYGVWSLIVGNLAASLLRALFVNYYSDRIWLPSFRFRNMRNVISFGGLVTLERAVWSLYTQTDIFIVGKFAGKELLGYYSVAMHLASLIMHKTGAILYNVVLPTFSKLQQATDMVPYLYLKAVRIMAFILFPIFMGMSVTSSDLVNILLGNKWDIAGTLLGILAIVMPIRILSNLLPPALQGVGQPKCSTGNELIASLAMPCAFLVGIQWGLIGISIAWVIAFPILFLYMIARSRKYIGVSIKDFLLAIYLPLLCSVFMYVLLYFLNRYPLADTNSIARIVLDVLCALLLYLFFIRTVLKKQFTEVVQALKK